MIARKGRDYAIDRAVSEHSACRCESLLLFLVGACLGAAVNLGIYRLAYFRRRISPWSFTRGLIPPRSWSGSNSDSGWWAFARRADARPRILGPARADRMCFALARLRCTGGKSNSRLAGISRRCRLVSLDVLPRLHFFRSTCIARGADGAVGGGHVHRFRRTDGARRRYRSGHDYGTDALAAFARPALPWVEQNGKISNSVYRGSAAAVRLLRTPTFFDRLRCR